jgi:hypothetical protein
MIRQNRFENIMMFSSLQTEEQVKSMFSVHIKSKHLEEFFTADLLNEYSGKFI